jgi:menaquinone-dependent protoporphyrinogen oxidase
MTTSILVTYATRYGSTQEVAEFVAAALRGHMFDVVVAPMRDIESLEEFEAVVMGVPLYIGRWANDAKRFLLRFQVELMQLPVACFTLGPTDKNEKSWEEVRTQLEQELARYPWLSPLSCELFGGRFDPAALRFPDSLLALLPASPLHNMPASDVRDWTQIRAWADKLVAQLEKSPAG